MPSCARAVFGRLAGFATGDLALPLSASDEPAGANAARTAAATASGPRWAAKSLKSVPAAGRFGPKSGMATVPATASAAARAFVMPGLPFVVWSSSAHTMRCASGYRPRSAVAIACRLPASNATAAG
ncbi:hypothetical protein X979_5924 [Burkholderia pseudomallei MSHR7527]|nr:hypothetical protein X979_5924 [Burkholderia pseudomallei MSHR7527]